MEGLQTQPNISNSLPSLHSNQTYSVLKLVKKSLTLYYFKAKNKILPYLFPAWQTIICSSKDLSLKKNCIVALSFTY